MKPVALIFPLFVVAVALFVIFEDRIVRFVLSKIERN